MTTVKYPLAILLLASTCLYSQTLTVTGAASVAQGITTPLTVTLAGSGGLSLAGIQWTLAPPAGVSFGTPTIGTGDAALGKGAYCSPSSGLCLAVDAAMSPLVNLAFSDGAVLTIPATFSATGTVQLPLTALVGVSLTDATLAVTSGAAYSIVVTASHCAYLGNATVTTADVAALIQAIVGNTACSGTFAAGCSLKSLQAVNVAAGGGACTL